MESKPRILADIKLYTYRNATYALHTYADGKQAVLVQIEDAEFEAYPFPIPKQAQRYYPFTPTGATE